MGVAVADRPAVPTGRTLICCILFIFLLENRLSRQRTLTVFFSKWFNWDETVGTVHRRFGTGPREVLELNLNVLGLDMDGFGTRHRRCRIGHGRPGTAHRRLGFVNGHLGTGRRHLVELGIDVLELVRTSWIGFRCFELEIVTFEQCFRD